MSVALAQRLERLEAAAQVKTVGDLAARLERARKQRHAWRPPFTAVELETLSVGDELINRIARGLQRAELVADSSRPVADPEELLIEVMGALTHDPYRFALFGWEDIDIRAWQREELLELGDRLQANALVDSWPALFKAWLSGNGAGKSAILSVLALWALSTHEGARVVVSAPAEHTLTRKFAPELNRWLNTFIARHWFVQQTMSVAVNESKWAPNWRLDLIAFNAANPAASAGLHNKGKRILLIADEAAGLEDSFFEVARGSLTDAGTEMMLVAACNPISADGEMARAHKQRELWRTRNIDVRTVEGVNQEQIEGYVREYGLESDFCRVRVLGIPPRVSLSALFNAEEVDAAMVREIAGIALEGYPVVVGIDPARLGKNSTLIATRRGRNANLLPLVRLQGANAIVVVERLLEHVKLLRRAGHTVHIVMDESGLGGPILDLARERGLTVHGVNFGSVALTPVRYRNRRAEIIDKVRQFIGNGGALPADEMLKQEMLAVDAWYDEAGRLQLEPKKDINAKLGEGRSTDALDSIALTVALEFPMLVDDDTARRMRERRDAYERGEPVRSEYDYDPLAAVR